MNTVSHEVRKKTHNFSLNMQKLPVLAKRQIDQATLPATYEAAKKALAVCVKFDELKDMADKHSAIAHYAKQIQDKTLLHYAERVYARALARIGDLLSELPAKQRKETAEQYGLKQTDVDHAVRISHLSTRARDTLIDKDPPASKQELSSAGWRLMPKRTNVPRANGFFYYTENQEPAGKLRYLLAVTADHIAGGDGEKDQFIRPEDWLKGVSSEDARNMHGLLTRLIDWFDELDRRISLIDHK